MNSQGKAADEGGIVGSPQAQAQVQGQAQAQAQARARVDGQAVDLTALLEDFKQHLQVSPDDKESGQSGSAKVGELHAFNAFFRPSKMKLQPQWVEIDTLCHDMRRILNNYRKYKNGDRLTSEDEMAVRDVLKNHPDCERKTGAGIDYIKIQEIFDENTRCFWVVRVDGTQEDFSYHTCLKAKAAKECPYLLEQYNFRYKFYGSRGAAATRRNRDDTRS